MGLELMFSVLAHSVALLANILPIDYFKYMPMYNGKGYAETLLELRN